MYLTCIQKHYRTSSHSIFSTPAGYDYNITRVLPQIGNFPFTRRLSAIDQFVSTYWCITIPIVDDSEVEEDETFTIKIFAPSVEVMAVHESVQVTIVDNDGKPLQYSVNLAISLISN